MLETKFGRKWRKLPPEKQYEFTQLILRDWGYWTRNIAILILMGLFLYALVRGNIATAGLLLLISITLGIIIVAKNFSKLR